MSDDAAVTAVVLLELETSCVPMVVPANPASPVFGRIGLLAKSALILAIVKGPSTPTPGKPTLV